VARSGLLTALHYCLWLSLYILFGAITLSGSISPPNFLFLFVQQGREAARRLSLQATKQLLQIGALVADLGVGATFTGLLMTLLISAM